MKKEKSPVSAESAKELTENMYQITYTLPESKHKKSKLLKMDNEQKEHFEILSKYFRVSQTSKKKKPFANLLRTALRG